MQDILWSKTKYRLIYFSISLLILVFSFLGAFYLLPLLNPLKIGLNQNFLIIFSLIAIPLGYCFLFYYYQNKPDSSLTAYFSKVIETFADPGTVSTSFSAVDFTFEGVAYSIHLHHFFFLPYNLLRGSESILLKRKNQSLKNTYIVKHLSFKTNWFIPKNVTSKAAQEWKKFLLEALDHPGHA
jgi:hypothetical protein